MQRAFTEGVSFLAGASTGIEGLDEITGGGLPAGKTMLAVTFLAPGATRFHEPGAW
jgi:circadian clock protein KaiC